MPKRNHGGRGGIGMKGAWRHWLLLAVGTVGLAGAMAMAVAISTRHPLRLDLTPDKAYTLAEHSLQVLHNLQHDVSLTAFLRSQDTRNREIEDLLWRVRSVSARVSYRVVDINRNPLAARQFGVNADGALVVESGGRRKAFTNPSEPLLIGAILQVTRSEKKRVYAVTGHGERSITDNDRRRGMSSARAALMNEFYEVEQISLLTGAGVPGDAAVLVIAGPRTDLLAAELLAIGDYLERGGGVLVLLDPEQAPGLAALLRTYHIAAGEGVVADTESRLFAGDVLTMAIPGLSPRQPVSAALKAPPLFAQARPVEFLADPDSRFIGAIVLETSPASWRSADREALRSGTTAFSPGRDQRGPVPVAVSVVLPAVPGVAPGRLLVIGDSDFANNFFIEYLGNKDLLVNAVNWLAHEEQLVGVRPQQQLPGVNQMFVSARQGSLALWLGTLVQPALFLALGLVVFLRRRFTG
ncbi:MAG: GldG family protein [Deltaproteobacteria bacterium]|nr:GldG family protein [Deltaproteobacteria bacterium]